MPKVHATDDPASLGPVEDSSGRLIPAFSWTFTVVDPTTQYYDYVQTADARVSKSVRFGRKRLQGFIELFNVPNKATILTVNETVGPLYFNPQAITQGRRAQFGAQIDW